MHAKGPGGEVTDGVQHKGVNRALKCSLHYHVGPTTATGTALQVIYGVGSREQAFGSGNTHLG